MQIRYYFSWFDDGLPETIISLLQEDLTDRKSLVMISGQPSNFEESTNNVVTESWLKPAGILFDEYQMIDYRTTKEEAHRLLKKASAIFLCGGYPILQNAFLMDYDLSEPIKQSEAVIIGASAGAINMSGEWLCSKNTGMAVETSTLYMGLGLENFFFCSKPQLSMTDTPLLEELLPLSKKFPIYVAVNEGAIRMKGQEKRMIGDVYLIENAKIQKLSTEKRD